jgi:uncharacterized protein (TIGR03435 family)
MRRCFRLSEMPIIYALTSLSGSATFAAHAAFTALAVISDVPGMDGVFVRHRQRPTGEFRSRLGEACAFAICRARPGKHARRSGHIRPRADYLHECHADERLLRAYDVKTYQLTGPEWMSAERYEIIAKVPPGTTKEQFNLMLQNLLAERFHLAVHHETKEIQGYELVKGKSGPKLKPSTETGPDVEPTEAPKTDANGFPQLSAPGLVMMEGVRGKAVVSLLTARAQPLSALVERLSNQFRLPVADKTGLTGKFDFTLEFAPQAPGALPIDSPDESAPNLVSAVPQQLGLRLEPKKIPTDIVVVDRADKIPTQN